MKVTRLLMVLALVLAFGLTTAGVSAQGETTLQETSVTIAAGESEEISFQGFCLEFGEPFPEAFGTVTGRASDAVLQVIKTALLEGTAESNPLELNLAIWSIEEGRTLTDLYPDLDAGVNERAQALLDAAAGATVDALADDAGISLDQAIADGLVEVTSGDFAFVDAPIAAEGDRPYHGQGTMTITNVSSEAVTVYYPYGLVLQAPEEDQQDLVTYATSLETEPVAQATATVAPSATIAPTVAATATTAATIAATATTAATTAVPAATVVATQVTSTMPTTGADDGMNPLWFVGIGAVLMFGALAFVRFAPRRS